ncbi:MAG: radical SAM protein [Deltaproteobacteria bacterium]|nr:radical SAM protein [Deltaproteobacteria bacterium]
MKTSLLFPPQWTAAQPYFGLATLNGQLRSRGHEVVIHDLNLEYLDWALSKEGVQLAFRRLENDRGFVAAEHACARRAEGGSERASMLEARLLSTETFLREVGSDPSRLAARVESAKAVLRDRDEFYDSTALIEALSDVDTALSLASLPFFPAAVRWNDFFVPGVPFNLAPMVEFCRDPLRNPFYRFLERSVLEIAEDGSDLLAISIASFSQVLPGLTLAMMLRERSSRWVSDRAGRAPLVALGGNFFTRLKSSLLSLPKFFELFAECVVIGEGERPITELAALFAAPGRSESDRPAGSLRSPLYDGDTDPRERLSEISSSLYLDGDGVVRETSERPGFSLAELAYQDLSGFPLDRYLAPERVVCMRASKGCYYGACSFCDADFGLSRDRVSVDRVVAEMRHLFLQFGVRHVEFVDQCLEPRFLDALSDALIAAELPMSWFCNARTETGFSDELFQKMRRAGNTMVMWGVESGSPRLLKLMRKGVSPKRRLDVLRASSAAGIFNFAYVFFGFPTETAEEASSTIDLIRDHTDHIHGYGRSVFSLGRHAPILESPERYGIVEWTEEQEELSTNLSFKLSRGLDARGVEEAATRCNTLCREAYGDPLWMALRSRENLHLYLARFGRDGVASRRLSRPADRATEHAFAF